MLFDYLVRDNRKILGSFSFLPRTGRCEINGRLFNKKRGAREREAGFTAQITPSGWEKCHGHPVIWLMFGSAAEQTAPFVLAASKHRFLLMRCSSYASTMRRIRLNALKMRPDKSQHRSSGQRRSLRVESVTTLLNRRRSATESF